MARKDRGKKPQTAFQPAGGKVARGGRAADNIAATHFKWSVGQLDWEGPFGWGGLSADQLLRQIIPRLKTFEDMTWGEIEGATGSHFVNVTDLVKEARKRLSAIGVKDIDQLFSLRMGGKPRIWGMRNAAVLEMLWWDPGHEVCPSVKKGS